MKKGVLSAIVLSALSVISISCQQRIYPSSQAQSNTSSLDTGYVTFTKSLKQRLDQSNVDFKKIQFYIDQPLVLSHVGRAEWGSVQNGVVSFNNAYDPNEIVIPAYTPGVCERLSGDSIMISFDKPNRTICFGALFANDNFIVVSRNWSNGAAEIKYDNDTYYLRCDGCGSAANAKLVIRKNEQKINYTTPNKTISGRMLK